VHANNKAARSALEREVHRFQAGNRHDRQKRKKVQRAAQGAVREETTAGAQSAPTAGRPSAVTSSNSERGATSSSEDAAAPASLRGSSQVAVAATAPNWEARWPGPVPEATDDPWAGPDEDPALNRDTSLDALRDGAETGEGGPTGDAETTAERDAEPSRRKKRKRGKPSAQSIATSLLLPAVRAKWHAEVAAFGGRREAPPRPYCPTDYAEAYALTADERRAIPKASIRHPNTEIGKLVTRVLGAFAALEPWRDEIACLPVDIAKIDRIPTYVRALSHSDAQLAPTLEMMVPEFLAPGETMVLTRQQVVQRLLQLALAARSVLHSQVKALIILGRIPPGALAGLAGGNGYYNTAKDVLSLIELLRTAVGCGATANISEEELERYTVRAYKLIEASALTSPSGVGMTRTLAKQERSRAYTLLWAAYREAQRALTCIFWDEADVGVVLPTLVVGAGRKPGR
jgi:hypothetical protein